MITVGKGAPDFSYEQALMDNGVRFVCGVDEAGRGPLAGPVVAGAVILDELAIPEGLNDSKLLSEAAREDLFERITASAISWSAGLATHSEIDGINILQATFLAMRRAIGGLSLSPGHVLVDGRMAIRETSLPQTPIVKGDKYCSSIAAASIIAKVTRDRIMVELDAEFPGYGFKKHKGYCTRKHVEAIRSLGLSPIHRISFHVPEEEAVIEVLS